MSQAAVNPADLAAAQPSTSTEGWHQSADGIRWATDEALAARTAP